MSGNLKGLREWIINSGILLAPGVKTTETENIGIGLIYAFPPLHNQERSENFKHENEDETVVVKIPKKMVLTADRILELSQEDTELKKWIDASRCEGNDVLHRGLLYFWLIKKDSPWKGYFDSLPKHIELPFTYSIKKMEGLDFSSVSLHYTALSKRLKIEIAYERFIKTNISSRPVSLEEWLLPHAWISSRGISHPKTDKASIVPIIDLCNHSSKRSNARYDVNEDGDFELLTTEPVHSYQGAELLINYGDRSASEFLFNYGFIPENRCDDDMDEVFKVFDPSVTEIRDVLDLSRSEAGLSDEERHELSLSYDTILEFFADHMPQLLRLVRLPSYAEPDKAKRYRFHSNFIMALASDSHLNLKNLGGGSDVLYFDDIEIKPTTVFDVAQSVGDDKVLNKARQLVSKLAEYFRKQVSEVSNDDPLILELATAESLLYQQYAETYRVSGSS